MLTLDTNILIEFFKQNTTISTELNRLGLPALAISVIVAAELYQGAFDTTEMRMIQRGLMPFARLPLLPEIGDRMLALLNQYALSHRLQFPDALIAATALHYNLPLYTLNRKDYSLPRRLTII